MKKSCLFAVVFGLSVISMPGQAADAGAAKALMKKSDCFKCHSVNKKKDGPPLSETAKKYKDEYADNMAEAEQKLYTHLTTNPKVEIDGVEEEHTSLKTKKDADIYNVIQWILSH
ncbi:MAG: c-type cytochrome [Thiohalomonadaceae bacterium]